MRQGGAGEGEQPKHQDHGESHAQNEPSHVFFKVGFLSECRDDSDNGQDENNGIVVKALACHLVEKRAEIRLPEKADTLAMEPKTDEIVFGIPVKNWEKENYGNDNG